VTSRFTTCGTQPRPCSRTSASRPATLRSSSAHSRLAITREIYTHENRQAHREALGRISEALGHDSELPSADESDNEADESDGG
jgi:hypothetical protein